MSTIAYVYTKPSNIEFVLPYSDSVDIKMCVKVGPKMTDVIIKDISDTSFVMIDIDDIDWLKQVLTDIQNLAKLGEKDKTIT